MYCTLSYYFLIERGVLLGNMKNLRLSCSFFVYIAIGQDIVVWIVVKHHLSLEVKEFNGMGSFNIAHSMTKYKIQGGFAEAFWFWIIFQKKDYCFKLTKG